MLSKLIWGGILILLGFSFIIKAFWGIDIPIFKPLLGLFFLYLGFTIIFAPSVINYSYQTKYEDEVTQDVRKTTHEYNVVFSKQTIDISHIQPSPDRITKIKINTVMGYALVITNPNVPTRFTVSTVFANADLPNASVTPMGNATYQTHGGTVEPVLEINLNVVFGSVVVVPEAQ